MESSNSSDYQERRVGPTVSKDKWVNHARLKLSKGYVLVIGKNKRSANFYLKSKGFEMCPYNVAKQLVKDGLVVEAGEHPLGTMYKLAEGAAPPEPRRRAPARAAEPRPEPVAEVVEELDPDAEDEEDVDEEDTDDVEDADDVDEEDDLDESDDAEDPDKL